LTNETFAAACPNPKCQREIEEPILLSSLSKKPIEQYYACPHCFMKLDVDIKDSQTLKEEEKEKEKLAVVPLEKEEKLAVVPLEKEEKLVLVPLEKEEEKKEKEEPAVVPLKKERKGPPGCNHDLGYLARRPKDVPIPQECLVCSKIVDCMLKRGGA